MTRGSTNIAKLAEAWINYLLEAEPGNALLSRQGLGQRPPPSPPICVRRTV
jgi:hypothetical protein